MRTRYIAALDGVELGELAPEIIVTDIVHSAPARTLEDHYSTDENSFNLTLKASGISGGQDGGPGAEPSTEHSLVGGAGTLAARSVVNTPPITTLRQ